MKEILRYDRTEENPLFDGDLTKKPENPLFHDDLTKKPEKHTIVKELESNLIGQPFSFEKQSDRATAVMAAFMSVLRKVPLPKFQFLRDSLECTWELISKTCSTNQLHIVFDSYIENSIKESVMVRRTKCDPLETVNLSLDSSIPAQIDRFWASSKNKGSLQILPRDFFIEKAEEQKKKVVLSGYVTDADGIRGYVEIPNGAIYARENLDSAIEKADCRIINVTLTFKIRFKFDVSHFS